MRIINGEGLNSENGSHRGLDIALQSASVTVEELGNLQRSDCLQDLFPCRRQRDEPAVSHKVDQNSARPDDETETELLVPIDADNNLGHGIDDHMLDEDGVTKCLKPCDGSPHRGRVAKVQVDGTHLRFVSDIGSDRFCNDGKAQHFGGRRRLLRRVGNMAIRHRQAVRGERALSFNFGKCVALLTYL